VGAVIALPFEMVMVAVTAVAVNVLVLLEVWVPRAPPIVEEAARTGYVTKVPPVREEKVAAEATVPAKRVVIIYSEPTMRGDMVKTPTVEKVRVIGP
jgi:hypothetical protein